ncbi:NADPH-dependent oxidoreductase [Mesobacillus maritimus]|uniref:NADPH-dependent oxidoreductase n=1 Tax=Mesobacillus maritimus TaxID=1643336 RepID=UPI00204166AA|nr:NADPH-dependent oxidoreductase [Mesobacillus maritimus]MCM3587998.1 NADPH-dependent oxidoreductase [Mesobacillus maritimus]MCM3668328.1 NADPH-dependent oxidoreductase [Mesobacillus maritimus]
MNDIIQLLNNHRSIREYDPDKPVTEKESQMIIKTAMAAPNWINGQQVSVIEVRDKERKAKLAKAAGGQSWIEVAPVFFVFCMDFYRAKLAAEKNGKDFRIADHIEAVIVGSTDVGIAIANASAAAESLGLGIVPIGGIRKNPDTVIEVLGLPDYVFPITGLVVGVPKNVPDKKPRLPLDAVYHEETYQEEKQLELINQYDEEISNYMVERTNGLDQSTWSSKVAEFYDRGFKNYEEAVPPALKRQGFRYRK